VPLSAGSHALPAAFSLYVAVTSVALVDSVLLTNVAMRSNPFGPTIRRSAPSIVATLTAALSWKLTLRSVEASVVAILAIGTNVAVGAADLVMLNELNLAVGPEAGVASKTILIARLPAVSDVVNGTMVE